jgi:hypothetical protein
MTVAMAGRTDVARPSVALQPGKTILAKCDRDNRQPPSPDCFFRPGERT